jgi:hypothetical protein
MAGDSDHDKGPTSFSMEETALPTLLWNNLTISSSEK